MPGRSWNVLMPCAASSALGPMPDRRRILGVSNAPAQRMTSLLENPATWSVSPVPGSLTRGQAAHTLSPANVFDTDDPFAFEEEASDGGIRPDGQVVRFLGQVGSSTRCTVAIYIGRWENASPDRVA